MEPKADEEEEEEYEEHTVKCELSRVVRHILTSSKYFLIVFVLFYA